MRVIDCVQGSPGWWEARRGVPTSSCFDRILTPKTCKLSAQADAYIYELIGDVASQSPNWFSEYANKPPTQAMQDGIDNEPAARAWYEGDSGVRVTEVGFVLDDEGRFGCSPDGLLDVSRGDDGRVVSCKGTLELKCPQLKTQARYLATPDRVPDEYRCQVHGHLVVTGCEYVDFCSYSPPLPAVLVRVYPDRFTDALREALGEFWGRYWDMLGRILRAKKSGDADNSLTR